MSAWKTEICNWIFALEIIAFGLVATEKYVKTFLIIISYKEDTMCHLVVITITSYKYNLKKNLLKNWFLYNNLFFYIDIYCITQYKTIRHILTYTIFEHVLTKNG